MNIQDQANYISFLFSQLWRIFLVESPCFGLTYADIVTGMFILVFLIKILKSIFTPDMSGTKDSGSGRGSND